MSDDVEGFTLNPQQRTVMSENLQANAIFTIGHSTRSIEEFIDLLRSGNVRHVVDVRSIPRSRTNPQYNFDVLPDTLSSWQIGYALIPELGGRRNRQKMVEDEVNGFWRNQSFHNYADYAMSAAFRTGLDQLLTLSLEMPCAIMCSEAVWWRCHRRIIADYLLIDERPVFHLMGRDHVDQAKITPGIMVEDGVITYPSTEPGTVPTKGCDCLH